MTRSEDTGSTAPAGAGEVVYDDAATAALDNPAPEAAESADTAQASSDINLAATQGDGMGCHAGADEMKRAAEAAGKGDASALCRGLSHRPA